MIAAILRAQWLSMRSFRVSSKTGASILSSVTGLLFHGFWVFLAVGAQAFFANPANRDLFGPVLSGGLLLVFLYWQITPIVTASLGASLDLQKLLVYPIPVEHLFWTEVLLRLTTCVEMMIILAGTALGLLRNPELGGVLSLPRIVVPMLLYVAVNLLLSAGLRNFLERLLKGRRFKEFTFFLIFLLSIGPQFLLMRGARGEAMARLVPEGWWLPWGAVSHILLGTGYLVPAVTLAASLGLAYAFGRWQFYRSLRFDGSSPAVRSSGNGAAWNERLYRIPSAMLPDPIAAIVEKEIRFLTRTPPFRMIFLMGCSFGVLFWLPHAFPGNRPPRGEFMTENLLSFATVYGVLVLGQVTFWNCFGMERSAAQVWFSVPVPFRKVLIGKNIAHGLFIVAETICVTVTGVLFGIIVTPLKLFETVCVVGLCALYLISFGNVTSVRFPRALSPDKINQGGSAKVLNLILVVCFPLMLLPVALAYWGRHVFESEIVFYFLLLFAAAFGAVLYRLALESATASGPRRREQILAALTRTEGPLSIS